LKVTDLSKRDFCRELSQALGLQLTGNYPSLLRRLQEHLENGYMEQHRWLIILDEAHDFRPEVLGILRILTNFQMDSRLVVSLLIAGQMPLKALLERESLRALADRLAHRAQLEPLSPLDLEAYIAHRCKIAGARQVPFDREALRDLYDLSRGNYRACDRLAYKALELTHDQNLNQVTCKQIFAAKELLS
jgi:general secretion pathway protein A